MKKQWIIEEKKYDPKKELLMETLFTLSNGYMASRGTLEEGMSCDNIKQYFGSYVAGVFDKYNADYQAIVNLPYLFDTRVSINNISLNMTKGKVTAYHRYLDMEKGLLIRKFIWDNGKNKLSEIEITRFISKADPHTAVLHYSITPLNYNGTIQINNVIDGNVSNIDFHISGYQLRDEKYYFIDDKHKKGDIQNGGYLVVNTKRTKQSICQAFRFQVLKNNKSIPVKTEYLSDDLLVDKEIKFNVKKNEHYEFFKVIGVYSSRDKVVDIVQSAKKKVKEALYKGYDSLFADHVKEWAKIWHTSNIHIEGNTRDDKNVRFNIFHLIQMGNKKDPKVNVGSRGLTSEMHYGNSFWDTELFIMPFFIYTDPDTARALASYRYYTLPEARKKATRLWFKGAMFPWMSSYPGSEQADYWEYANIAVHIVSDVAYGLMHYYKVTNDIGFILKYGLEILIETARFWQSRCYYNKRIGKYVINNVKGPNEYDGVTNNNTYTNWCARENLINAKEMCSLIHKQYPKKYKKIIRKIKFQEKEILEWSRIIKNLYINYDKKRDLYIEDDMILDKRPVDIKKMKPGKKITTELGLTWDTIIRHRVVKQADVLLLMFIHRDMFTTKQLLNAWKFYEPITLHDSSLSYNTHSIFAAELGFMKKSYDYFQQTVRLDIDDMMENAFLGIHAANAGGAWQCVINGFCGMRLKKNGLEFKPNLPMSWKKVEFKIIFRKHLFKIQMDKKNVEIALIKKIGKKDQAKIKINKNSINVVNQ